MAHLQRAFEIHRRLVEADLERAANEDVLDRLPTAVFLLGEDRRVLFANAAARGILSRADGLALTREGRLTAANSTVRGALERAVSEACLTGSGRGFSAGAAFRVARPEARPPYSVVVSPLGLRVAPVASRRPAAVVLVGDPERPAPPHRVLEDVLGLTGAQAALTRLLTGGDSLETAADRLGVTRGTARWTLKQIFQRTGSSRQSELLRLVDSIPGGGKDD